MRLIGVLVCLLLCTLAPPARAQWNPADGQWGKSDINHLRVMTWNVRDRLCSTASKTDGNTPWHSLVVTVAALKPDVIIMQETGDNSGNGTGSGVDSVTNLETTIDLFLHGGADPFNGGNVGAWVQRYAPGYDLPYVYVPGASDGFNRNIILSRFPFADLNGDGAALLNDIFLVTADQCAPGGTGGIRGFQFAEIDLPDDVYLGDVVIGNGHLKAGGTSSDLSQRLAAAQNIQYFIYNLYAGAGTSTPDPAGNIRDLPQATSVLSPSTPVIWGGDWNEDEQSNGRRGPAEYMAHGCSTASGDGTDRDGTDSAYDNASNPFNGSTDTRGGSKLDYLVAWDSAATNVRGFIFQTTTMPSSAYPPELLNHPVPANVSNASDHLAVCVDYLLDASSTSAPGAFALTTPADGATGVSQTAALAWDSSTGASNYSVTIATDPQLTDIVATYQGVGTNSFTVPDGVLLGSTTYSWGVTAHNALGATDSTPISHTYTTVSGPPPGDFSLISPIDNSTGLARQPAFNWGDANGVATYTLTIARDEQLTDIVATIPGIAISQYTMTTPPDAALSGCTTYHWGVTATNSGGVTSSTPESRAFTTGTVADLFPDGNINTNDFFAFLVLYQNGETAADITLDGAINTNDFFAFLVAYQAGC